MRLTKEDRARLRDLRERVRADAEERPGVYRMVADDGEVVYVGKSKKLRTRLLSYFRGDHRVEKGPRIVREVAHIEWSYAPSEFAALLEELHQIKRLRPRFNVALKRDGRHYAFVAITRGPAPRLVVLRGTGGQAGGIVYGPFVGAERLRDALRALADSLGLRDCALDRRMQFADQQELFEFPERTPGCIRHELGTCLGPCIAAVEAGTYLDRVVQARAFLEGSNDGPIERLERDMLEASEQLAFERAAALRDKSRRLSTLRDQFGQLRFAVESLSFLYEVPGFDGEDRVYLIRRGVVRADVRAPRDGSEELELAETARRIFNGSPGAVAAVPTHEVDELLIITSWFKAHPTEFERTRRWECPPPAYDARVSRSRSSRPSA